MRMADIIEHKKQGLALTKEEIDFFVKEYTNGDIPDYQASALAMAIYFNKMTNEETAALTLAMAKSGDMLDLSEFKNSTVDKHSSGGVGDKTTLVVAPIAAAAGSAGMKRCFLPISNVKEGQIIENIDIIGVENIKELAAVLNDPDRLSPAPRRDSHCLSETESYDVDFSEVNGQFLLKRATEIAVAGMHNILYIGSAGTGKTMMARRIPTIMPSLSHEENIEISKIYSICGLLPQEQPLLSRRPFRSPHHTISPQALTGGGRIPKPGEISLASRGVLFLDELPEFQKNSIEVLRQPLEERKITISRLHGACEFPADFMLVAAMNPCKCGYYPDRSRCTCTEPQIRQYLSRISKPLLDRIDICAEAVPMKYEELKGRGEGEPSSAIRERVEAARIIQRQRLKDSGIYFNSAMNGAQIRAFCSLDQKEQAFLKRIFEHMGLSARGYGKILKVARTIADLAGSSEIKK